MRSESFSENTSITVVKLGCSLAPYCDKIIPVLQTANRSLLIVPGGGTFANNVRDSPVRDDPDASHWMACAAMDQYGYMLSRQGIKTTAKLAIPTEPRIFLPYCTLRRFDPLPHSWDLTSDTIAAWVADKLHCDLVVLKSVDGIISHGKVLSSVTEPVKTETVDPAFIPFVISHKVKTFVFNGTNNKRVKDWVDGKPVPGTVIGTTF